MHGSSPILWRGTRPDCPPKSTPMTIQYNTMQYNAIQYNCNCRPIRCLFETVHCKYPGTIENGQVLLVGVIGKYEYRPYAKSIVHNVQIEFHCDKEYKLVGPAAATCVDGQWSPENKPICVQKQHPRPLYIYRGRRSPPGKRRRRRLQQRALLLHDPQVSH